MTSIPWRWFITVIIMLTAISKAFGMSSRPPQDLGATRKVNLSGNVFQLAMPEDFSKDMPADNMVESLDITKASPLADSSESIVLQRWWDIKEPGFFGKKLGTVMLNLSVRKVTGNTRELMHGKPFDIRDRMDFMMMLQEDALLKHPNNDQITTVTTENRELLHSVPDVALLLGSDLLANFHNEVLQNQVWTRYSVTGPDSLIIVNYALPLTVDSFIEASFYYSPNSGVPGRHFRDLAYQKLDRVRQTFHVQFAPGNPMRQVVEEDWHKETPDEVVNRHSQQLVTPLFGPEARERLLLESVKGAAN